MAYEGGSLILTLQMGRNTEVGHDDAARRSQEDVGGFANLSLDTEYQHKKLTLDISMDDALAVEVDECDQRLAHDDGNVLFLQRARLHLFARVSRLSELERKADDGADGATGGKVHGEPELRLVHPTAVVGGAVVAFGVPQLREHGDFALDLRNVLVRRVELDDLDGHDRARGVVDAVRGGSGLSPGFSQAPGEANPL
jgi:hypothetical protein